MKTHLGWRVCLAVNETNSGIAHDALYQRCQHHTDIPQIQNRRERERERKHEEKRSSNKTKRRGDEQKRNKKKSKHSLICRRRKSHIIYIPSTRLQIIMRERHQLRALRCDMSDLLLCLVSIRSRGHRSSHRLRGQGGLRQGMWVLLEERERGKKGGRGGMEEKGKGLTMCVDQIAHKQLIVILRSRRRGLEIGIIIW
jgi:hypothetical protein